MGGLAGGGSVVRGVVMALMLMTVVTWNLQRVSLREQNRGRLRRVAEWVEQRGWEVVLVTELFGKGEGVIWMGENEHRTALVHGRKAGVLLRGTALLRWIEEGQQKWIYERVTAVLFGGIRLVAVYQPVWMTDGVGLERCRRDLESQLSMCRNERLLIGGDWNANVGRGSARNGVCGEFGVGNMNDADRDLIEWCEANGLAYANSIVRHAERGTWFNRMYGRWYELDGFVVRQNERHRMIRRMRCERMNELSDHKPKKVVICVEKRRWRAVNGERKGGSNGKCCVIRKRRKNIRRVRELSGMKGWGK